MPSNEALAVCQSGFEGLLVREAAQLGFEAAESGPGWALLRRTGDGAAGTVDALRDAAFCHAYLEAPGAVSGEKVNDLAQQVLVLFAGGIQGERIETRWPCVFSGGQDVTGLGRRVASVEAAFHELLGRRLGRLERLATQETPRVGTARGLFVWFTDFGKARVSRSAHLNGPRRMADDDAAPSRSYLKIEESYGIIGAEPSPGETVCDLGSAPGGWSYSAAKRGARVVAVDNGPMKGGALGNPLIDHRLADAFGFSPGKDAVYDWLFCDILEDPRKVLQSIVRPWLSGGWCRRFVINFKFGRVDPIEFLGDLRGPDSPFVMHAPGFRIVQLYHDREEFTVVGTVKI